MYRSLIATATAVTVIFCATTAGAQQDTTHKGMPGMKMPAPTKPAKKATPKPKSVTKTGARATTTSKAAPKTTRKSTTASKPRPRPQTTKTQPHD
ncbi:MAG: hypothetical protein ACJ77R_12780, partial [Gemmatimonadaceae bacterium]